MSFKGIAWAGNIYEKFEAMCLEVEEAMYQDTVKYMENQVQKVGVSVKKFYSEVMDDLRPLSCVDPKILASDDLSLIPHGFTDVQKRPIPSILLKKENEDLIISNVTAEKGSSPTVYDVNLFSPQSPGIFIENKSSEKCAASKKIGIYRSPIGIKRISRNYHPLKESSRDSSVSEDRGSKVANNGRTSSRVASDNTGFMSSLDLNGRCEPRAAGKGNAPILDNVIESPASDKMASSESVSQDTPRVASDDKNGASSSGESEATAEGNMPSHNNLPENPASEKVSSAEPTRQTKDVADCISPGSENSLLDESERLKGDPESTSSCFSSPTECTGAPVKDIPFSVLGSSIRIKVCNLENNEMGVTFPDEGVSMKDGSSSSSSTPGNTESCNNDLVSSRGVSDSFDEELVENEEAGEKFETSGKVKLEESCILVGADDLNYALQGGTRKHKSYKRRIREALSSKLKSRQDHHFVSDEKQETSSEAEKQTLSAHDSVESGWELL